MGKVSASFAAIGLAACFAAGHRAGAQEGAASAPATQSRSLFSQSAAQIFEREFAGEELSYLFLDAGTGQLLASRWPDADRPIPLGSLVKPFTALAYAQHHEFHYPTYLCHGAAGGCWQPRSHGRLDIAHAIAFSCNSYFRELAADVSAAELQQVAAQVSLDPPAAGLTGEQLMGIGSGWPIAPMHMARAYLELARRRDEPGVREILTGLVDSAEWGTGSGAGRSLGLTSALVKTGTSVCRHTNRGPGDGFAIVMSPADAPDFLLMVRLHAAPGSAAAATAGRMLARLEP